MMKPLSDEVFLIRDPRFLTLFSDDLVGMLEVSKKAFSVADFFEVGLFLGLDLNFTRSVLADNLDGQFLFDAWMSFGSSDFVSYFANKILEFGWSKIRIIESESDHFGGGW